MSEKSSAQESESSMEEILSSIKRIIAEDKAIEIDRPATVKEKRSARRKEPVDLNQDVPPLPPSIVSPDNDAEAEITGEPAEEILELTNELADADETNSADTGAGAAQGVFGDRRKEERLIDDHKLDAMRQSLSALVAMEGSSSPPPPSSSHQTSLEDMTRELMKPMLKQWLDANLPGLVEELVAREIRRISDK